MSSKPNTNIGGSSLILGSNFGQDDFNIIGTNGRSIKINGVIPSSGGGGIPPVGDIDFIGNLNCNDQVGGGAKGIITAEKKVVSGLDGIFSSGEIKTGAANDIHSGKDLVFDGTDVYKAYPNANPAKNPETYKEFKNLIAPEDNTTFTGTIKYRDNAVSIQALNDDVPAVYENTITLNTNGNIQCETINNVSEITTGTLVCDNGGTNECKAKVFNTRTSGTNGWNIKQAEEEANPPQNQANNILQIAATQAQVAGQPVEIYVTSSEYDPSNNDNPNIKLIPDTVLNGGKVQAAQFDLGTAASRYYLKQDIGGLNDKVLQIKAPTSNASVNFKDNLNADVLVVKNTAVELGNTIPINFGAYSFLPIQFYKDLTAFSFNNSALGATNLIFTTNDTDWTNVNTGATNQQINLAVLANQGAWKLTFRQTSGGALGEINAFRIMSDMCLSRPNDNLPQVVLPSATAYSFEAYDGAAPIITMSPGFLRWNVYATFPQTSGNETSNVRITLTKMQFFA